MGIRFSKKIDHLNTKLFSEKEKKIRCNLGFLYIGYMLILRFLKCHIQCRVYCFCSFAFKFVKPQPFILMCNTNPCSSLLLSEKNYFQSLYYKPSRIYSCPLFLLKGTWTIYLENLPCLKSWCSFQFYVFNCIFSEIL